MSVAAGWVSSEASLLGLQNDCLLSVSVSNFLLFQRNQSCWVKAHPKKPHFHVITSLRFHLLIQLHSEGLGLRTLLCEFGRDEIQPIAPCHMSTGGSAVKNLPAVQETQVHPWVGKIPWRRKWQPIPVFLPEKSHGQRSPAGYSAWGHRVRPDLATK